MLRKFFGVLSILLTIAFALSMLVSYLLQTSLSKNTATDKLSDLMVSVNQMVENNDLMIKNLREQLDEQYIQLAESFSEMIALNPEIINDFDELLKIQEILGADEIHVCDENGVLQWGTIEGYYGFDFSTSEQTKAFLPALTDKSFKLAQDPMQNGATGLFFQYIGVARKDKPGIVQVGMTPSKLDAALSSTSDQSLVTSIELDSATRIFICNKDEKIITGDSNSTMLGKTLVEIGLPENPGETGIDIIDKESRYWNKFDIGDKTVFLSTTTSSMYQSRNMQLITTAILTFFIFVILLALIAFLVSRQMIKPIHKVISQMNIIENGDYTKRVTVRTTKEFVELSEGINHMVSNINTTLSEAQHMTDTLKDVVSSIEETANTVETFSNELSNESRGISQGAADQTNSVNNVNILLGNLSGSANEIADKAIMSSRASQDALNSADEGSAKMIDMVNAVQAIDGASRDISKVIRAIDDIAFQTNILALNAAVEAARAGQYGKGFAVVAEEVRNLASKSADAAKQTEALITTSMQRAEIGVKIAQETSVKIQQVVQGIKESSTLMEGIASESKKQTHEVTEVQSGINEIMKSIQITTQSADRTSAESVKLHESATSMTLMLNNLRNETDI